MTMKSTEEKLKAVLDRIDSIKLDETVISDYEQMSKEFENLVERGVAKPRGYNLLTIEDAAVCDYSINAF